MLVGGAFFMLVGQPTTVVSEGSVVRSTVFQPTSFTAFAVLGGAVVAIGFFVSRILIAWLGFLLLAAWVAIGFLGVASWFFVPAVLLYVVLMYETWKRLRAREIPNSRGNANS